MIRQASPRKRIEFIDLLRGWAVIVMIETHVFNATLTSGITSTPFFQVLNFINGLVAPTFLFAAGMAYAVTTRRKIAGYLSFGPPLFRQIGRLLLILLIGYSLHIPKFNYHHLRYEAGEVAWHMFWQSDVLQCIAVSLLILQFMLLVLRTERRLYLVLIGITTAVVVATPVIWGIDFWGMWPVPLASFMNGLHYSLFPIFPWSAFLFAGALSGYFYLRAGDRLQEGAVVDPVGRMMTTCIKVAVAIMAASFLLHPLAAWIYPVYDYWRTSPSFFLLRLGIVLVICSGLFWYEKLRGVSSASFVTLMGRESLFVYTVHLLLVYGKFGRFTFADRVRNTFEYPGAILTTLVLLGAMYLLACAWSRVKSSPPRFKYAVEGVVLAGFLAVFFFGPE